MGNCAGIMPGGSAKKACLLDQPTNLIVLKKGTKFNNTAEVKDTEIWRVLLQETLNAYITLPMSNVTPSKPALNKETTGAGSEIGTRISPGGALVNLQTNACDFKEMLNSMQGDEYSLVIGLGTNKIMMRQNDFGEVFGFTAQVTSIPIGMTGKDAKLEDFQLDINYQDVKEWNQFVIIELPVLISELTEYIPLGLGIDVTAPLSGTDMSVFVTQKCQTDSNGNPIPETEVLTSEIISDNVDDESVTIAASVNGLYVNTLEKDAVPAALEAGNYINYKMVKMTGLIYEKISTVIKGRLPLT